MIRNSQSGMRSLLLVVLVVLPSFALAKNAPVAPASERIVHFCQALYNSDYVTDDIRAAARKKAKQEKEAGAYFDALSRNKSRQQLEPELAKLRVGSDAYASVAYILAYYGVDVKRNVERMASAADKAGIQDTDAWVNLPGKLIKVYHKHPADPVLGVLLAVRGDAHLAEELSSERGQLFVRHPRTVLRVAAAHRDVLSLLADDLSYETYGEDSAMMAGKIHRVLKSMAKDSNGVVRNAARYCLGAIQKNSAAYQ